MALGQILNHVEVHMKKQDVKMLGPGWISIVKKTGTHDQ